MKDRFNCILQKSSPKHFNAVGDDDISTALVIGSRDPMGGNNGNVGDLQRALNRLGASPKLVVDGVFGTRTKEALKSLGYFYPVMSSEFYLILSKANASDASAVTESDFKAIWAKDKNKYGKLNSEPNYEKWLKRQRGIAGIKDFGKGLLINAADLFKKRQTDAGVGAPPSSGDEGKIWGMPAVAVYAGGAVLVGLGIWGIVSIARRKPKQAFVPSGSMAVVAG